MKFLEILFGKLLDVFFKKDSSAGISIKNQDTSFQARDITNNNISNNTTYQQTIIVDTPKEAPAPVSDIEIRHQNFWSAITHGIVLGGTALLTILFCASNKDMYHKTDVFPNTFNNMHWVSITTVIIGMMLSKKAVATINNIYNFIFSESRKEKLMVPFGTNPRQNKMVITIAFFIFNVIVVYCIAKVCFLTIK